MLWLESPTNPMLGVADIRALTAAAQAAGAVVVTDNTFSTPLVQQPLALGSDIVLHSVTKYLSGHSDVVLGALVTSNAGSARHAAAPPHHPRRHRRTLRGVAGPARAAHPGPARRAFPGLGGGPGRAAERAPAGRQHPVPRPASDPGHERAKAQMKGFGSILCIEALARRGASGGPAASAAPTRRTA